MNFKAMNIDDIIDWCIENKQVDWLKKTSATTFPTADGKTRKISFIEIKLEFVKKFMPEIAPKAQAKKPSMYDRINAL